MLVFTKDHFHPKHLNPGQVELMKIVMTSQLANRDCANTERKNTVPISWPSSFNLNYIVDTSKITFERNFLDCLNRFAVYFGKYFSF